MASGASSSHSAGMRFKFKQDMPPPSGYQEILWQRTFPKTWANARRLFIGYILVTAYGYGVYVMCNKRRKTNKLEDTDIRCAIDPFLYAERDRNHLKVMRKNRDLEIEVMKDVPGWKAGTWYGEPIYFTLGERWWDLTDVEIYPHAKRWKRAHNRYFRDHSEYAGPKWYDKYLPQWILENVW